MTTEIVYFRHVIMSCCGYNLYWIGMRLPSFCPACSRATTAALVNDVRISDPTAELIFNGRFNALAR